MEDALGKTTFLPPTYSAGQWPYAEEQRRHSRAMTFMWVMLPLEGHEINLGHHINNL